MTDLHKQALRNTADRDWFESWFKSEFHPDKTGHYIKDQLFFAIQAARKPLLDELEAAEKLIAELEAREVVLPAFPDAKDSFLRANMQAVREMDVRAIRDAGIITKVGE